MVRFIYGGNVSWKYISIFLGCIFFFGGCALLYQSYSHNEHFPEYTRSLEKNMPDAEQNRNKDDYDHFKLHDVIISPVIISEMSQAGVKKKFIGLMSKERWNDALKNLDIHKNDTEAAGKLLNSPFKPCFFIETKEDEHYVVNNNYTKTGDAIKTVEGNKVDFNDSPQFDDTLQVYYSDNLPIVIKPKIRKPQIIEDDTELTRERVQSILILVSGLLMALIPLIIMYKKYMNTNN